MYSKPNDFLFMVTKYFCFFFQMRRVGTTFYTCIYLALSFIILKIFPIMLFALDVYGSMLLFACVLIVGILFTIFVVRETKGVKLDVLEANIKESI